MGDHLDMSELLGLFLEEAGEQLQRMDEGILALEQNPDDLNIVNDSSRRHRRAWRAPSTVEKGGASGQDRS